MQGCELSAGVGCRRGTGGGCARYHRWPEENCTPRPSRPWGGQPVPGSGRSVSCSDTGDSQVTSVKSRVGGDPYPTAVRPLPLRGRWKAPVGRMGQYDRIGLDH